MMSEECADDPVSGGEEIAEESGDSLLIAESPAGLELLRLGDGVASTST